MESTIHGHTHTEPLTQTHTNVINNFFVQIYKTEQNTNGFTAGRQKLNNNSISLTPITID